MEGVKARFFLTGFGQFQGVTNNPTTELMNNFIYQNDPELSCVAIESYCILETSAEGSLEALNKLFESSQNTEIPVVFLHCGVNSSSKAFAIENYGYNLANFSIPDERGYQPSNVPIIEPNGPINHHFETKLPIDQLVMKLKDKGWDRANKSQDPGRFVCNWVYYHSLNVTSRLPNYYSLFLHVPPFSQISFEEQCQFIKDLIILITRHFVGEDFPKQEQENPVSLLESLLELGFDREICEMSIKQPTVVDVPSAVNWILSISDNENNTTTNTEAIETIDFSFLTEYQNFKLVLLVRQDLEMGKGKVVSQCCHAALEAYRTTQTRMDTIAWKETGEAIICLKVANIHEMNELSQNAQHKGIPTLIIHDAGRTQVIAGSATVAAIGPAEVSLIDSITGHLKLY